MYVALGGPKGYETVTVREDVYDPATGGKSTTIVRKVGKLSDLLAEDPDFMARLKEEVRLETLALKEAEDAEIGRAELAVTYSTKEAPR